MLQGSSDLDLNRLTLYVWNQMNGSIIIAWIFPAINHPCFREKNDDLFHDVILLAQFR